MLNRIPVVKYSLVLLVGPALLCVLGCWTDDGLGTRYSVSGTVTYKGEPVPKADITFIPLGKDAAKQGASGHIENGSYSLSTLSPDDGALPGEYKVTVSAREVDEAKLKSDSEALAVKHKLPKSPMIPQELQAKANKVANNFFPRNMKAPARAACRPRSRRSNRFDFELKD